MLPKEEECLCCLSTSWHPMDPIFGYIDRLKSIFGDSFEFDAKGMPQHICSSCKILLRSLDGFREQIESSKRQLMKRLDLNCPSLFTSDAPRIANVYSGGTPNTIFNCLPSPSENNHDEEDYDVQVVVQTKEDFMNDMVIDDSNEPFYDQDADQMIEVLSNSDDVECYDQKDPVRFRNAYEKVMETLANSLNSNVNNNNSDAAVQAVDMVTIPHTERDESENESENEEDDDDEEVTDNLLEERQASTIIPDDTTFFDLTKRIPIQKTCPICGLKRYRITNHILSHSNRKFACPVCKKFCKLHFAMRHLVTHRDSHSLSDAFIEAEKAKYRNLKKRTLEVMLKPKPTAPELTCRKCDEHFTTKMEHQTHVVFQHVDKRAKLIKCHYCEMKFQNMNILALHSVVHINNRFVCKCSASFTSGDALRKHWLARHQDNPGFIESITNDEAIVQHLEKNGREMINIFLSNKWETKYLNCLICMERTDDIRNHIRKTHAKIKPACSICERVFATSKSYKKHMVTIHHIKRSERQTI